MTRSADHRLYSRGARISRWPVKLLERPISGPPSKRSSPFHCESRCRYTEPALRTIRLENAAVRKPVVERLDAQRRVERGKLRSQCGALPIFFLARQRSHILSEHSLCLLHRVARPAQPQQVNV